MATEVASVVAKRDSAAKANDFNAYAKYRKQEEALRTRLGNLKREILHNQRDMDGTKTGRAALEQQLAQTTDLRERKELENRLAAGSALRFARQYAYEQEQNPRTPLLRIA